MRLFGIIAIFVLSIAAIVEGALLVRMSSRLDSLAEKLESAPGADPLAYRINRGTPSASAGAAAARPPVALPRLVPAPGTGEGAPDGPATTVLRQALETPEGRAHLKHAMEVLREQERQERMVRRAEEEITDEQRYQERLGRLVGLNPDEKNRISQYYTTLHSGRRRVLEEMRAGVKNAEQADDEIDNLEEETQRQVRALLGDARLNKYREANRAERRRERGRDGNGAPGANGAPATATAPPSGSPPAQ